MTEKTKLMNGWTKKFNTKTYRFQGYTNLSWGNGKIDKLLFEGETI